MGQQAVVIGGGAIGLASAFYLSRSGWQVTLIEQGRIGLGCSYANAGLIVPSHSHPLPGPGAVGQALRWMLRRDSPFYVRPSVVPRLIPWLRRFRRFCTAEAAEHGFRALLELSRSSLDLFDQLVQGEGLDFFYRREGLLHVYVSDAGAAGTKDEHKALEVAGFRAQVLSRRETREFEPTLSAAVRGGLFIDGEAHGSCFGYLQALTARLEADGATLLTGQTVTRLAVRDGRVEGVYTAETAEQIPADLVVVAAGVWTPPLVEAIGLKLPLQPAKGYSCTVDTFPGSPSMPILIPERRVIITPMGDRVRFAGTLELAGLDDRLDETRYQAVIRAAHEVLTEPFGLKNEEPWCGFRPVLPDGLPVIDRVPHIDGLIVATGHAMLGFTQSPITGKLVAQLANGEEPSVPLAPFRLRGTG